MANRKMLVIFFSIMLGSLVLFSTFLLRDDPASPVVNTVESGEEDGDDDVSADPNLKPLYITVHMKATEFEALKAASDRYQESRSSLDIHLTNLADQDESAYETFKRESQLRTSADVMLMDNHWVLEFAALGYLNYVDEFYGADAEDMLPAAIEPLMWNGFVWGVPMDVNPYALVVNRDKLAEFGFAEPPADAAELLAQVSDIRNAPEGLAEPLYFDPTDAESWVAVDWPLLRELLVSPSDKAASTPPKERFPAPSDDFDPWRKLADGELVYLITTLAEADERNDQLEAPMDVVPLPQSQDEGAVPGLYRSGRSFVVSSSSEVKAEALDWIRGVNSSGFQQRQAIEYGTLPAWAAAYQSPELRRNVHPQTLAAVEYADQLPAVPGLVERLETFRAQAEAVWEGDAETETLLTALEQLRASE